MIERARDLGLGFIVGLVVAAVVVAVWPSRKVPETYAPEVRRQDGSVILERKPEAKPAVAHKPPAGSKRERVVHVDIRPTAPDCPLCSVDLSLVKMRDASRRVIASSTTGEVVTGIDIPLMPSDPASSLTGRPAIALPWTAVSAASCATVTPTTPRTRIQAVAATCSRWPSTRQTAWWRTTSS